LITVNRLNWSDINAKFVTNVHCTMHIETEKSYQKADHCDWCHCSRLAINLGDSEKLFHLWALKIIFYSFSEKVQTQLFHKYNILYQKFLIDINSDYCALQSGAGSSKMLKMLLEIVLPDSGLVHKCPYQKGVSIYWFFGSSTLWTAFNWIAGSLKFDTSGY
jgi:hypothetical protein